jgi:hypothetical protein
VTAHTLAELGVRYTDYRVSADSYHTRRLDFLDDAHSMLFCLNFCEWLTTLETEEREDRERFALLAHSGHSRRKHDLERDNINSSYEISLVEIPVNSQSSWSIVVQIGS